jgi:hypothetical protein
MELNPNHPVTSAMSEQWHKIVVLLMMKFNKPHIEITVDEIEKLASSNLGAVTIREKDNKIILDLVSWKEAERLARQEGGLPV